MVPEPAPAKAGDEARIGQKNKITRRWARRGTRPSAPKDQRTKSAYIFGTICPEHGKPVLSYAEGSAGLVLPFCNTETMSLHLTEISLMVAPGAHAVVMMDQARWHTTGKLVVPDNISIIALPAKCPELNPVENIWQFMRDNWLSNRVFTSYDNIVDHCCEAWIKLIDQPWHIMTIGRRKWAHGSSSMQLGISVRAPLTVDVIPLARVPLTPFTKLFANANLPLASVKLSMKLLPTKCQKDASLWLKMPRGG